MDRNIIVYSYYLNLNFGFIDHQAFRMLVEGTESIIYFEKVEHTAYHPYRGEGTNWQIQNGTSFDLSVPNRFGSQDIIGQYFIERSDIFSTGYTRKGIASIVNIRFDTTMPHEDRETFAEKCLNRFLDIYRLMTFHGYGDNYLNNKNPVFKVQEGVLHNETQFKQDVFNHGTVFTLPPEDALKSFNQQQEIINRIAGRLMIDRDLKVYEKMLNAGKKLFIYDEDYPLAIVMFGTAFETYVQSRLIDLCEDQDINELRASNGRNKPYQEVIEKSNIGYLLEKHLCDLSSAQNIRAEQVCMTWDSDAYQKRNQIIHRGNSNFARVDAERAYLAVISFIEFIHTLTPNS